MDTLIKSLSFLTNIVATEPLVICVNLSTKSKFKFTKSPFIYKAGVFKFSISMFFELSILISFNILKNMSPDRFAPLFATLLKVFIFSINKDNSF